MSQFKPSRIDWGSDAAERDSNLLKYFVYPPNFDLLVSLRVSFVLGRKGTGKSALLKKLKEQLSTNEKIVCLTMRPGEGLLQEFPAWSDYSDFSIRTASAIAWQAEIYRQTLAIVGDNVGGKLARGPFEDARTFALAQGLAKKDPIEAITSTLKRLLPKKVKMPSAEFEFDRTHAAKDLSIEQYEYHLKALAASGFQFVFLLDDLDRFWTNSQFSNNLLLGLLEARSRIESIGSAFRCIIFLRDDIYHVLLSKTMDSDKLRDVFKLNWKPDGLRNVLLERIRHAFIVQKGEALKQEEEMFRLVFPDKVGNSNFDKWLEQRTFGRPRDAIQLAKLYTQELESFSEQPVSEAFGKIEQEYSKQKLDDLCSEFLFQYPDLRELFDAWSLRVRPFAFRVTFKEFSEFLEELLRVTTINQSWFKKKIERDNKTMSFAELFYELGIIGDVASNNRIIYRDHSIEPKFEKIEIHPAFRIALGWTHTRSATKRSSK